MKNSVLYIVGATVLLGGAFLFLKNKKAKDLAKLDKLGGTTPSGTTPSGTTPSGTTSSLSTTSDGVSPSDANVNLANATILVGQKAMLKAKINTPCVKNPNSIGAFGGYSVTFDFDYNNCEIAKTMAKKQLVELDTKLASLGYKVDAIGQLVKI